MLGGKSNSEFAQRDFHLIHSDSNLRQGYPITVFQLNNIYLIYILTLNKGLYALQGSVYTRNAYIDPTNLPEYLPSGEWRLDHELYIKENGEPVKLFICSSYYKLTSIGTQILS